MIAFSNPRAQYLAHQKEIDVAIAGVLNSGQYILGENVAVFEQEFSQYLGATATVGVASGTDALVLALKGLGIGCGDEVILPSFTATATAAAVCLSGAKPVFADVETDYYTIDPKIISGLVTENTKAIIAVHLYGQPADINALLAVSKKHQLKLIEDCAQAVGARYHDKYVGTLGDVACFSFFPTKNLGAIGDGGAVVTNDTQLAKHIRSLRQYGWDEERTSHYVGMNSRLDELQAAILRVKLKYLDDDTKKREEIAKRYKALLTDTPLVLPRVREQCSHAFHLYVIQSDQRDLLREKMREENIYIGAHYPKAVHQMPVYDDSSVSLPVTEGLVRRVMSLPMYPELGTAAQQRVVDQLNACIMSEVS